MRPVYSFDSGSSRLSGLRDPGSVTQRVRSKESRFGLLDPLSHQPTPGLRAERRVGACRPSTAVGPRSYSDRHSASFVLFPTLLAPPPVGTGCLLSSTAGYVVGRDPRPQVPLVPSRTGSPSSVRLYWVRCGTRLDPNPPVTPLSGYRRRDPTPPPSSTPCFDLPGSTHPVNTGLR